jgi:hypothetical protein
MRAPRPNPRIAKVHRCYTIAEAAELYGCHRNTIRLWMRQGLAPVGLVKPLLFHGTTLNAFHADRRRRGKRSCELGEIYCLPCHRPRRPEGSIFTYKSLSPTSGTVTATCPECGRPIHQRVNPVRLAAFEVQAAAERHGRHDN